MEKKMYLRYLKDVIDVIYGTWKTPTEECWMIRTSYSGIGVAKSQFINFLMLICSDHELQCRKHAVSPLPQLLVCQRLFATGHFQRTDGDLLGISGETSGEIKHWITKCLIRKKRGFLSFLQDLAPTKTQSCSIAQFLSVIGAIDCRHVHIVPSQRPGFR